MSGTKRKENPFMKSALSPIDAQVTNPDLSRPDSKGEIYIATKHKEDMFKEASTVIKAGFAIEGQNHLRGFASRRHQENETEASELELATPMSHRENVENYNSALSTATGNGTIRTVQIAIGALNKVVEQTHDIKDEPITMVERKLSVGERFRGSVMIPSKE